VVPYVSIQQNCLKTWELITQLYSIYPRRIQTSATWLQTSKTCTARH